MIDKKKQRIVIYDQGNNFLYEKNKSNLDISFNRISFIFFIFFIISLIYSIHLIHLGSRKVNFNSGNDHQNYLINFIEQI